MRLFFKTVLFLALTILSFEILMRLLGKERFEHLYRSLHPPQIQTPSDESLKYRAWFNNEFDSAKLDQWITHWRKTDKGPLSRKMRYIPLLENGVPFIYAPGQRDFILQQPDGTPIYQAVVNIDNDGFRRTILPKKILNKSDAYLFIGDSYTFGYGLNDQETFTSKFAEMNSAYTKNIGIVNTGPNDLLYTWRDGKKINLPPIEAKTIHVIYTFDMEYYGRAFMASDFVDEGIHNYYNNKPYYREQNGRLEYLGRFEDQHLKVLLFSLYNLTAFNKVLKYVVPTEWQDLDPEMALIIKELKDFFVLSYPKSKVEFYVSSFPFRHELASENLLNEIGKQGIKTISFAGHPLDDILPEEALRLPADMHPSPMSSLLYAKMLSDYFKLK